MQPLLAAACNGVPASEACTRSPDNKVRFLPASHLHTACCTMAGLVHAITKGPPSTDQVRSRHALPSTPASGPKS